MKIGIAFWNVRGLGCREEEMGNKLNTLLERALKQFKYKIMVSRPKGAEIRPWIREISFQLRLRIKVKGLKS